MDNLPATSALSLISCIMPTANRRRFVPLAIKCFLAQDYPAKELVIVDDGDDAVADLIPADPRLRYLRPPRRLAVGAKRNLACEAARGEIIAHWDDDDWSAPWRLSYQARELARDRDDVCGLARVLFVEPAAGRAFEYVYPPQAQAWVYGATLCYQKGFWRRNPFPEIDVGEDARFVWNDRNARIGALADNRFFVGFIHPGNTSPKQTSDSRWSSRPLETIQGLMGADWALYGGAPTASARAARTRRALVSAAYGIGDVIRITPLIRALYRLGYAVDVLLAPDYPETADLIRGAPEVRRVVSYPELRRNLGARPIPELAGERYDLATFTVWSAPLARWIKAERTCVFAREQWLEQGDLACVATIAQEAGWQGELPEPFAIPSQRRFDLPRGTVALHPGCKTDWPWKKWHGFGDLARILERVAIVGAEADLDNRQTYFGRPFQWPEGAKNFVGQLNLADTAALISQCAALVANDSGLMHLGVALGVPTFGIFGITSPRRETIPSRFMFPITKGLACEPACRRQQWGRRDCEHHLECLKTLAAEEVAERVGTVVPEIRPASAPKPPAPAREEISINYYGYVFDASGYGQAARTYIHALHGAGIRISVVDIGSRPSQVEDELTRSLLGHNPGADFNLFHGIPSQWGRIAYPLRNVIAMTVWETDTMPQHWRNPLTHAVDVWLPCAFNVEVFSRALGRPIFHLPHAVPPRAHGPGGGAGRPALRRLGVEDSDFVFYSIFEWQERKNPRGVIEAFLRAFAAEGDAVLVIKTNPGASVAAQRTLEEVRIACGSRARVRICCEAWSDAQMEALHDRGDCYISLHRGEGWGYPLFEAARRGKPAVATGYSGPADYLDPQSHWLVRHNLAPVRQAYTYYHPTMRWAEPDIAHASEGIRSIYANPAKAREAALRTGQRLSAVYGLGSVGEAARARLLELLARTDPARRNAIRRSQHLSLKPPPTPIPGDWYDADYFETGLKSNWERGYTWPLFKGVFQETAAYLAEMFPEARSLLDAGCAKGFLVRALRERGLEAWGFDHSPWAIAQADFAARPFIAQADVETVSYERGFDLLVAMSLLESLTEEQILIFLSRARVWTRQALIAVIATLPRENPGDARAGHDLSQITLRDRRWWRERFLEAGWHQDAMHRIVERACRSHPLPAKMGWNVYVFSPGPNADARRGAD